MSRVQLALSVSDVDAGVVFYSKLFATAPSKRRPGYANFAISDPPLKLVLIEDRSRPPGSLNHLGVEVGARDDVAAAAARLEAEGLETCVEEGVTCCYAVQDKVWVDGPDGEPWEVYTVLSHSEVVEDVAGDPQSSRPGCCAPQDDLAGRAASTCG